MNASFINSVIKSFAPGDVVWAKVNGYPWWPAVITSSKRCTNGLQEFAVNFLAENAHAILGIAKVVDFQLHFEHHSTKCHTSCFLEAIRIAQSMIAENPSLQHREEVKRPVMLPLQIKSARTGRGKLLDGSRGELTCNNNDVLKNKKRKHKHRRKRRHQKTHLFKIEFTPIDIEALASLDTKQSDSLSLEGKKENNNKKRAIPNKITNIDQITNQTPEEPFDIEQNCSYLRKVLSNDDARRVLREKEKIRQIVTNIAKVKEISLVQIKEKRLGKCAKRLFAMCCRVRALEDLKELSMCLLEKLKDYVVDQYFGEYKVNS